MLVVLAPYPFYRRLVTMVVLVQTGWYLSFVFPAWMRTTTPALNKPFIQSTAMALGIASIILYLTMGTIREVARGPDTVYGIIERQADSTLAKEEGL
jgi:cytochrome bd-type quinol oxidase subunit 1